MDHLFSSQLYQIAIPHAIELTTVMRQEPDEKQFITALKDLRMGICSKESETFFERLSTGCELNLPEAIHIFFKKIPAIIHNHNKLDELPGDIIRLDATTKCPWYDLPLPRHTSVERKLQGV